MERIEIAGYKIPPCGKGTRSAFIFDASGNHAKPGFALGAADVFDDSDRKVFFFFSEKPLPKNQAPPAKIRVTGEGRFHVVAFERQNAQLYMLLVKPQL